jgi:hypothetical protein
MRCQVGRDQVAIAHIAPVLLPSIINRTFAAAAEPTKAIDSKNAMNAICIDGRYPGRFTSHDDKASAIRCNQLADAWQRAPNGLSILRITFVRAPRCESAQADVGYDRQQKADNNPRG